MVKKTFDDSVNQLKQNLNDITAKRSTILSNFKDMQVFQRVLLQNEERRLTRKLGEEHPRVKALQTRLDQNLEIVGDLEVELEIANIKVPEVEENDVLIHGRVIDENLRGINGLTVFVQDEKGKKIRTVGSSETNASGYYGLKLDQAALKKVSKREDVFLAIRAGKDKVVFDDPDPLTVTEGDRVSEEVVLKREDLSVVRFNRTSVERKDEPGDKDPPIGPDVWVVRGRIIDEKEKGWGGLIVSLYDKDLFFDDILGTVITDEEGAFQFIYRTEAFRDLFEKKPDIYIKVLDDREKSIYTSRKPIKSNAGREEDLGEIKIKRK